MTATSRPPSLSVQYRFGEACLEEMHPGRIVPEEDRRRNAERGGHRKKGRDRGRKYESMREGDRDGIKGKSKS